MQIRSFLVPSAAACLVALALSPPAPELTFHPEEGRSLTKTFESQMSLDLDELSLVVDGQDMGAMMGDMAFGLVTDSTYVVTDEYASMGDGRPEKLHRTFDELSQQSEVNVEIAVAGMAESQGSESASELEGLSVVFTWNADDSEYDVAFADGDGDEALLEGLEEDMDMRGILPDGPVSEGDSWEIAGEKLAALAMPGGNLKMLPEEMEDTDMEELEEMFGSIQEQFGTLLEDAIDSGSTATFTGMRDVDGTEMAVIALELDVTLSVDLSEILYDVIEQAISETGAPDDLDMDLSSAQLDASFEGSGEMLWNAAAGHMHTLDVSGEVEVSMDVAVDVEAEGESHSLEAFFAMVGDMKNSIAVE